MTGKVLTLFLVAAALAAGLAMYYLQVYAFYEDVPENDAEIVLMRAGEDTAEPIPFETFEGIDADSSPIRYRACFSTEVSLEAARERFEAYPDAAPRVAPGWFSCFDAEAIGEMIADGRAGVFLSEANIEYGIDRVVAITEDGFGYVWHEINDCGEKSYDGTPLGEDCPPRPES
ncbi:hypothetical protein ROJ8625_01389 [Roseivivax jejudonensis]|uniref:Histidine kinase n=1 Tax=Roseivivax jejudonensis TaxID=1529041 RepID=A0A1X6YT81_9RHOB|nr:DUF6446 family protein [Roseivivax jejudonensis]SLN30817.1 hypothetical protein ROJ8625_01389 [Roseivivax jejudonensis]